MKRDESFGVVPLRKQEGQWYAFVVKRTSDFWEFPKGHADEGETPLESAARELQEETGLTIERLIQEDPLLIKYQFSNWQHQSISKKVYYYIAEVSGEAVYLQPKEVVDGRWVPLSQADQLLTYANSQNMCRQVLALLS